MRTKNVVKNSLYSLISFAIITVLALIVRKVFIANLDIELLGVEGLFVNVISLLSMAELGVASVISYGLYREIANQNKDEINLLMSIYRKIYAVIGMAVLIAGIIIYFFLPYIVKTATVPWKYVQIIYCIQIIATVSSYYLAYRRTLFVADQKEYICIKIDMVFAGVNNILKLLAIVIFHSYLLYTVLSLVCSILANLVISIKCRHAYPYLRTVKVSREVLKKYHFFGDIKNFLVHKLSYMVYSATDNIIISAFLDLKSVAIHTNYELIRSGLYSIVYKLFKGIIPGIGNLIYSEGKDKERAYGIFQALDLTYFVMAELYAGVYFIIMNTFIELFFGTGLVFSLSYAAISAVNVLIGMQFENAFNFRSAFGEFEYDRKYMVCSAVCNLVLSIILTWKFGVNGVMIGTVLGLLFIVYGRIKFVFKKIFTTESMRRYIGKHVLWSSLTVWKLALVWYLTRGMSATYVGLVGKALVMVIVIILINLLIYCRTEAFKIIVSYIKQVIALIVKGRKQNESK